MTSIYAIIRRSSYAENRQPAEKSNNKAVWHKAKGVFSSKGFSFGIDQLMEAHGCQKDLWKDGPWCTAVIKESEWKESGLVEL